MSDRPSVTLSDFDEPRPTEEELRDAKRYLYYRPESQPQALVLFREMDALRTNTRQLAQAVLLFYTVQWSDETKQQWIALTGYEDATTRTLADFARRFL